MLERSTRPPRGEIDRAALELLARHSAQILATARRYSANADDAEDAYQRGLEILLTKAPTTREEELVPWLKTVVKHEAFALRRQAERLTPVTGDGQPVERGTGAAATHDQAERHERLRQGAEALRRLKPQEIRCMVLKAQGLSYREICAATGFSYTKVNRCLTEGRQALTVRMAGIEGGIECARLAPLLSALADGEADAQALAVLRPHMKTCLTCRARLREFRSAPARVAALLPPAVLLNSDAERGGLRGMAEAALGALQGKAEAAAGAVQQKAGLLGERAQTTAELLTGQKVAALAAGAAAVAGGGTAVDQFAGHQGPPQQPVAERIADRPEPQSPAREPTSTTPPVTTAPEALPAPPAEPVPAPAPEPPPPPDPAAEFGPVAAEEPAPPSAAAAAPRAPPAGGEFAP